MLTGFDSKWVNTLCLDKLLEYENIIQAFSRTNRLFGPDKPFGTIRYYSKPHTMKRNVEAAVKLYSGDKPIGLFADRLPDNLKRMTACFVEISAIFNAAGITAFMQLPDDLTERAAFAKRFQEFNRIVEAAKIQGFTWEKAAYEFDDPKRTVELTITEHQYLTLLQRYKELTEILLSNPNMFAFCYTQLTNVEQEVNGLYTYERVAKFDPAVIHKINTQKAAIENE